MLVITQDDLRLKGMRERQDKTGLKGRRLVGGFIIMQEFAAKSCCRHCCCRFEPPRELSLSPGIFAGMQRKLDKKGKGVYTHIMAVEVDRKDLEKCVGCACFNLRKASRAITQIFDRAMQPSGLRATQFPILGVLAMVGPSTITQLSQFLVMDRTTLARNLRPLERGGLVSVGRGKDRRTRTVSLTRAGADALADALPLWEKAQNMVVERLGENRWNTLLEGLLAIPALFPMESGGGPAGAGGER